MKHQFQLNNRVAVIDIGSNSVRLMMTENGKKLYKLVEITRLSLGMSEDGRISDTSAERTVTAVLHFYEKAKADGADKIYAFATACCRNASNGNEFVDKIYSLCGLRVEIIDGETEAKIGFLGACGNSGGVIDIGGASTEIIVKTDGETNYAKSVNIGVVRLFEWANNDRLKTELKVKEQIAEFGEIPKSNFFAIGGTATSMASVLQELSPYNPDKVHGYVLTESALATLTDRLFDMTVEEKRNLKGLQRERAEVIVGGACLLLNIMKKIGVERVTISESDNLEGYLRFKTEML